MAWALSLTLCAISSQAQTAAVWPKAKAQNWFSGQPWRVGANFLPSTAINQLEMWQAETFDAVTIDRELGWAEGIGMNVMRVYLHDLAWKADPDGFKKRMDRFLTIAAKHHISILFTLLDDCWNPEANVGPQPKPKPGVHNSGWVRSPTRQVHDDATQWGYLKEYVQDVLRTFKDDNRIYLWDLYNEPANSDYGKASMPLLKSIFEWAWEIRPSQPLSSGVWFNELPEVNDFQIRSSDVVTFHNYSDTVSLKKMMDTLLTYQKPLICTEYMARTNNSRFLTHLPIFRRYGVPAINWGLVSGKSNTIFPWGSKEGSPEPSLWFHDVFHADGKPYDPAESALIKKLTTR
jgi:hypothetical protein